MSTDLAALSAKLDLVLMKLDEMNRTGKPGMTQVAFAKLVGVSPQTVCAWRRSGRIRTVRRLVPHSEVRKFLS